MINKDDFLKDILLILRETFEGSPEGEPSAFLDRGIGICYDARKTFRRTGFAFSRRNDDCRAHRTSEILSRPSVRIYDGQNRKSKLGTKLADRNGQRRRMEKSARCREKILRKRSADNCRNRNVERRKRRRSGRYHCTFGLSSRRDSADGKSVIIFSR